MGKTLQEIAQELKDNQKKVQLIYAFNGTGKTRLSREFKELFSSQQEQDEETEAKMKVIYYNAFTEDLFHWDNDLYTNRDRKLIIIPNSFTDWVLREEGQEANIISNFQHYTNDKLMPNFIENYTKVSFSLETGDDQDTPRNIKISRGEESCFIWCVFYSLFQQIVGILNIPEKEARSTDKFDDLEYIFIDDPVSSLDENHLIELAVNIAELIKSSESDLKFVITTHNPLFYNVLYNELGLERGYLLRKNEDQTLEFEEKKGDSNQSFSYHLFLKKILEEAIQTNSVQKYHFTLLRNLYEKTANFLGYPRWAELLPDDKQVYYRRIIQFTSHSTLSNDTIAEPTDPEKQIIKLLLEHLVGQYQFKQN
ncbi:anticodon nuclease [Ornithobacterium rhinotracheale]|uniref:anticodon nuclease n=1 Tax=Ornithobacterium rhinotracheale TaxID=28251 RepID=UPI003FA421B3